MVRDGFPQYKGILDCSLVVASAPAPPPAPGSIAHEGDRQHLQVLDGSAESRIGGGQRAHGGCCQLGRCPANKERRTHCISQ